MKDKLSNFEHLLFVTVAKTAWYESIGSICAKYLQETMSHYFSFLQFSSNKFSVWCWNCILRVQRKSLASPFSDFSWTLPGFWATVFEKECQNRILCYQWYLLQEKTKNFNFKTSHWVSRTIFRKSWQNHFPFVQGHFLETKCFLQKTYIMKFPNFSSKKLPTLRKKSHSVDKIASDEHGETKWRKIIFLKKTVCSRICYRHRAGILRQFSRGCFLHIHEYTSGRKCRQKKGLLFLFLKSDLKTCGLSAKLFHKDIYTAF